MYFFLFIVGILLGVIISLIVFPVCQYTVQEQGSGLKQATATTCVLTVDY